MVMEDRSVAAVRLKAVTGGRIIDRDGSDYLDTHIWIVCGHCDRTVVTAGGKCVRKARM